MRLVIVTWYDSVSPAEHWSVPYSESNPARCQIYSAGWFLSQNENWVYLAGDYDPEDLSSMGRLVAIPTPCVIAIIDVPTTKP